MASFCDDRCTNATGDSCDCECDGANHGGQGAALHPIDRSERDNPLTLDDSEIRTELRILGKQAHRLDQFIDKAEKDKEATSIEARASELNKEKKRREQGGAQLGSVSHGTMRSGDLLHSFRSALEDLDRKAYREHMHEFPDLADVDGGDSNEDIDEAVQDLDDRLNECAPDGAYFGAHPGDGSDYGFWLAEE